MHHRAGKEKDVRLWEELLWVLIPTLSTLKVLVVSDLITLSFHSLFNASLNTDILQINLQMFFLFPLKTMIQMNITKCNFGLYGMTPKQRDTSGGAEWLCSRSLEGDTSINNQPRPQTEFHVSLLLPEFDLYFAGLFIVVDFFPSPECWTIFMSLCFECLCCEQIVRKL